MAPRKSSFSGALGNCIHVDDLPDGILLRVYEDERPQDPGIGITRGRNFQNFKDDLLAGRFTEPAMDGLVRISMPYACGEVLTTQANLDLFLKGLRVGEFDDYCRPVQQVLPAVI